MTDFVLEQRENHNGDFEDYADLICRYAKFLKKPLELWMFVPCDEEGNVLEKPEFKDTLNSDAHFLATEKYQQAKERRLFEGFFNVSEKKEYWAFTFGKISIQILKTNTIESLIDLKPQLTQTAIEKIGL